MEFIHMPVKGTTMMCHIYLITYKCSRFLLEKLTIAHLARNSHFIKYAVHYHINNSLSLDSILNHLHPVHTLKLHFMRIHFNITLPNKMEQRIHRAAKMSKGFMKFLGCHIFLHSEATCNIGNVKNRTFQKQCI